MRILVVGGGGREHALCWALSQAATVFCAPGNPGTRDCATNLPLNPNDHHAILDAVRHNDIDVTVIGPEAPLAKGLVDSLQAAGHPAFGPTKSAAQIEASKAFAKDVMAKAGVATGNARVFTDKKEAFDYIATHAEPLVVKASGLAAGKGVVVCSTREEAQAAAAALFGGRFGEAGTEVLVEQFLEGEELSVFALTDGEATLILPTSQDHKRLREKDLGPNTGGMGAYAPVSIATDALLQRIDREVIQPTLAEMASRGMPYRGVLYAGLMIAPDGKPYVVEFNCRFGEAGTEVLVEQFLEGEELSVFALTDGEATLILPTSQDHKRLREKDLGPNTGGMGAYAPVSMATDELLQRIDREVIQPTLAEMASRGMPYRGVLYAGLMIAPDGKPYVVEFNCRFGDPEAQVVLPIAGEGLADHIWSIAAGERWAPPEAPQATRAAVTTVLAAPGYPESPQKGNAITLPPTLPSDTILFHAGTNDSDGTLRVSGGRVLCATGVGPDVPTALAASHRLMEAVAFEGKVFRRDIGWREIARAGAS